MKVWWIILSLIEKKDRIIFCTTVFKVIFTCQILGNDKYSKKHIIYAGKYDYYENLDVYSFKC